MGKIIVTQYISLDGVIEDPVGMENSGLGNWIGPFSRGPDGDKFKDDELNAAQAILLGRRTYEGFAAVWPTVQSPMADRMNALPKYVASRTLSDPEWNNSTIINHDLAGAARALKASIDGDVLIYGSASVCHALIPENLVDEYVLTIYPIILGRGLKLFPERSSLTLKTVESRMLGDLALLRYRSGRVVRGETAWS